MFEYTCPECSQPLTMRGTVVRICPTCQVTYEVCGRHLVRLSGPAPEVDPGGGVGPRRRTGLPG